MVTKWKKGRPAILGYVFGVRSSADLTSGQAGALIDWIGATEDNYYTHSDQAVAEADRLVRGHLLLQRQIEMVLCRDEEE